MTSMTQSGIAYDDRGSGSTALLFLPGWCGPRTLFAPLTDRLDDTVRTLALDWRGHGDSKPADGDFGTADLVADAMAVIADAGVTTVIPVSAAHAGWVAIALRKQLGAERVPRLVFLDWMVLGAPPPFLDALGAMANPDTTRAVVDQVTTMWIADLEIPELRDYVRLMSATSDEMWARAAREISAAFAANGTPLDTVGALDPPPPTLHLYAQPADPAFLDAQRGYAASHPWFDVVRLDAQSHFPMFEVPEVIADRLRSAIG